VRTLLAGVPYSLFFDTGAPWNTLNSDTREHVAAHLGPGPVNPLESDTLDALDSLVLAGRTFTAVPFNGGFSNILGYPFLSQLGVVGFNPRARQLILYR
jgi:hypothetical protein